MACQRQNFTGVDRAPITLAVLRDGSQLRGGSAERLRNAVESMA